MTIWQYSSVIYLIKLNSYIVQTCANFRLVDVKYCSHIWQLNCFSHFLLLRWLSFVSFFVKYFIQYSHWYWQSFLQLLWLWCLSKSTFLSVLNTQGGTHVNNLMLCTSELWVLRSRVIILHKLQITYSVFGACFGFFGGVGPSYKIGYLYSRFINLPVSDYYMNVHSELDLSPCHR